MEIKQKKLSFSSDGNIKLSEEKNKKRIDELTKENSKPDKIKKTKNQKSLFSIT